MSVYMTEEEQLENIKKWWKRHQSVITTILSVVLIVVAGYRYWNWHVEKTTQQASIAYENMMISVSTHDDKSTQSYANQLVKNHEHTMYATAAHLTLAKVYVSAKNYPKAREELEHVAHHSKNASLKAVGTIRLARLLLSEQHYDNALTELASLDSPTYAPVINELKGDIFSAKGEYAKAEASYETAVKDGQLKGVYNRFLVMKHDAVAMMIDPKLASRATSQVG